MSQQSLASLLGNIKQNYAKDYDDAKAGKNPAGDWNADLPLDLEYRIECVKSEYKSSKAGNPQLVLTWEVLEPVEYAGSKFQDYQGMKPTTTAGGEILSKFLGTLGASLDVTDEEAFGKQFEGKTVVAALRSWGTDNDRIATRYVNIDKGQTLSTAVKPPKGKAPQAGLTADVQIPKAPEVTAAPVAPPVTPPEAPQVAQPVSTPAAPVAMPPGVNLPPGISG